MPEISVIVPVYMVENYLDACVQSLRNQTFQDIEIILVDDGSPDNCPAICDTYATQDNRIRVIHQKNAGLSCARNAGVRAATGQYICFVDSDDLVSPHYCRTLYDLLHNTTYDFSVCGTHRFEDGTTPSANSFVNEVSTFTNEDFFKEQLAKRSEFGVWNKLYRRELFQHLQFAPGKLHEDVIWSGDLAGHLHNGVICTNAPLYFYRQRAGSIVNTVSRKCSPDYIFAGEHLVHIAESQYPTLVLDCIYYTLHYPWMFVDGIYVHRTVSENRNFLNALQLFIRKYASVLPQLPLSEVLQKRMRLFAKSRFLYGFNAYTRLLRVYLYRILGKDAYKDGHGI